GKKIAIQWSTGMEANSDHFEVRHSSNGLDFYPLASVTAKRNTTTKNTYTIYDNTPSAGTSYYQLIQYDIDGRAVNYGIRTVNSSNLSQASVKIYPNPVDQNTGIFLNNMKDQKVTVNLFDGLGSILMQKEIKISNGQGYLKLDAGRVLKAGNYILYVQGDAGFRENMKVIVQ
ncbi:MAG: T9SS type A sorting domain-containing protein, partial [Chitinophagaceae bacterium]